MHGHMNVNFLLEDYDLSDAWLVRQDDKHVLTL